MIIAALTLLAAIVRGYFKCRASRKTVVYGQNGKKICETTGLTVSEIEALLRTRSALWELGSVEGGSPDEP